MNNEIEKFLQIFFFFFTKMNFVFRFSVPGKKTTNFDAMRDLNGRRVRHVKAAPWRRELLSCAVCFNVYKLQTMLLF